MARSPEGPAAATHHSLNTARYSAPTKASSSLSKRALQHPAKHQCWRLAGQALSGVDPALGQDGGHADIPVAPASRDSCWWRTSDGMWGDLGLSSPISSPVPPWCQLLYSTAPGDPTASESQPVEHVKGDRFKLWSAGPAPQPPVSSPGFMALMTARQLRSTAS